MEIGWIGLGMIGTEMVKRLLDANFSVTAYERGDGLEAVKSLGAKTNSDYRSLARSSDLLILCVFSDVQVRDIVFGQDMLTALRPGSILAIHTTGSPALMREIAAAAPAGVHVLDATFSGGPHDVAAGRLTLMVGGDAMGLEQARPAFATYAGQIHHLGAVGGGQIIKLLNNLLFATNLMNAAHVLELAGEQQFDTALIAKIIGTCSGASYAMARFEASLPMSALLERVRPYLEKDVSAAVAAASSAGLAIDAFDATARYFQPAQRG